MLAECTGRIGLSASGKRIGCVVLMQEATTMHLPVTKRNQRGKTQRKYIAIQVDGEWRYTRANHYTGAG